MKPKGYEAMPAVPDRISQPALRRLQLRMRKMRGASGGYNPARQGQGIGNAVSDCALQGQPTQSRDSWFAERSGLGTRLSDAEMQHGYNAGIISAALLM